MPDVSVSCLPEADGWRCDVMIEADGTQTRHRVAVAPADLDRLAPGATDPTDLVRRSFAFLLERESPQSILRSFELPDIARYFPEYEAEIGGG
jgi:hypothetical protein